MVLIYYAALNVIALFLFFKYGRKNLHILEVMVYWMVSTYLFQNFSALCYMNFKTIIIPEKLSIEFSHVLNRIVLYPIVMVTFLNFYLFSVTFVKKFLLILFFVLLLAGLEGMSDYLGVIIHVHWRIWWSFCLWISGLLFLIGMAKLFRRVLFKGGWK